MGRLFLKLYSIIAIASIVFFLGVANLESILLETRETHAASLSQGTYFLLAEKIANTAEAHWPTLLADEVKTLIDVSHRLAAGEVVYTELTDGTERYYRKISDSPDFLQLGPFTDSVTLENIQLILMLVFSTLVALAVFLWVYPLSRDMKRLDASTHAFGQGDFSTRASDNKRSVLYRLATSFNAMADRIQSLISSHKELTNAVSHELRTPIARLRFGMEMLQDSTREEDRARFMASMNSDIDELDQLVAELLTYARFDRDRPELEFKRQEISPWLDGVIRQARVGKSQLSMDFGISDPNLKYARFDPLLMARALANLLQNAARYAHSQVNVSFALEHGNFKLIVDDDGPGIAEAERDSIFDAFKRLDSSRDRGSGGYGLGLSIAYRISEWHGGEIRVSDSPLGGARFEIRWPQEKGARV